MPGDKMVILAEGQAPIFADKLRFFRTAPFRDMERFSQANLPDVPATEFLPHRTVPATTPRYVGEESDAAKSEDPNVHCETGTKNSGRKRSSVSRTKVGGRVDQDPPAAPRSATPRERQPKSTTPSAFDAAFVKAAQRLRSLAKTSSKPDNLFEKKSRWARVFDETVPDELEIVEAELH